MQRCELCNTRYAECEHHLIFGSSRRKLADEDGLVINVCNECHTLANSVKDRVHDNPKAEILSKMLGQALFERNYLATNEDELINARGAFIGRYGRSYL